MSNITYDDKHYGRNQLKYSIEVCDRAPIATWKWLSSPGQGSKKERDKYNKSWFSIQSRQMWIGSWLTKFYLGFTAVICIVGYLQLYQPLPQ